MNKIKLFIIAVVMVLSFSLMSLVDVDAASDKNSVYNITDTTYDEDSGKLSYQKISYNQNTYTTTTATKLDANGQSVDVSDDAQYVFLPARYLEMTNDTKVSIKFKNNGVKKILVHAEYAAGISSGGVDYEAGIKLVCMNALSPSAAWNVSLGKSVDGYDVTTILFGSYVKEIYDVSFVGLRLYFDYGNNVTEERQFEIFGYEIHESSVIPTFASDPKPTRVSKLKSDDVVVQNNKFTVNGTATVTGNILDAKAGYEYLAVDFRVKNDAQITFKLDGNIISSDTYEKGTHLVNLPLNKEVYSSFEMVVTAVDTLVVVNSFEFKGEPYFDSFSGSAYTITETENGVKVQYTYKASWNYVTVPIREYNKDYSILRIEFEVAQETLIGVYINDLSIYSHWSKPKFAPGKYTLEFDLTDIEITSSSALLFYLDPDTGSNTGTDGTKTVTFTKVEFAKPPVLPSAEVTVDSLFEFNYDGTGKVASGATTNSGANIYYEYKLAGLPTRYYDTKAPVNVGEYDVRVVSERTDEYALTYAYTKLVINKAAAAKPNASVLTIDYLNSRVNYDSSKYLVSRNAEFTSVIPNGGYVEAGSTLYYKVIETNNNFESEVATLTLSKTTETFTPTINYSRERTKENIPTTVEYSLDGVNWTTGNGKVINLETGNIYLFRVKATENSFAGAITYVEVEPRAIMTEELVIEATDDTSVTIKAVDGAEYRTGDSVWQSSNVLTGLTKGTTVTVCIRMKATNDAYASHEAYVTVIVGQLSSVGNVFVDGRDEQPPYVEEEQKTPTVNENDEIVVETTDGTRYVVSTYAELTAALKNTSKVTMTTIVINGSISLQYDITVSGQVTFVGGELLFEYNGEKRTMYNDTGSDIRFENVVIKRTVADDVTEKFLLNFKNDGSATFTETTFDVAINETGFNQSFDRITYCPSGVKLTLYFNNCTFNTEACFYRGTMVFFNNKEMPTTAGSPTVYDFSKFKFDYTTKTFRIPASLSVSEDEDFVEVLKSGDAVKSDTTYYVTNGEYTFSFTTKNLKLAKPTIDNLAIDYNNEKIYFSNKYVVALDADFTQLVSNGDAIVPGMKLYVKRVAEGIYFESDAAEIVLPERPNVVELAVDFTCSFGFVMKYHGDVEYAINGSYYSSPVFTGLQNNTTYVVTLRIKATDSSFASEAFEYVVTTK